MADPATADSSVATSGPRSAGRWFALAALLVALDQLSKWAILSSLAPGERIRITPFFDLVLVFNKGAAFSFLADAPGWQQPLFMAIAAIAAVLISVWLMRAGGKALLCFGLSLILSGAVGNLIDRVVHGQVVDFLLLHAGGWHWPAFNLADSAITVGAGVLIFDSFRQG